MLQKFKRVPQKVTVALLATLLIFQAVIVNATAAGNNNKSKDRPRKHQRLAADLAGSD